MRLVLRLAVLAAVVSAAVALDRPSSAPKQSIGNFVGNILKPAKSEKDVDMGAFIVPVGAPPRAEEHAVWRYRFADSTIREDIEAIATVSHSHTRPS